MMYVMLYELIKRYPEWSDVLIYMKVTQFSRLVSAIGTTFVQDKK